MQRRRTIGALVATSATVTLAATLGAGIGAPPAALANEGAGSAALDAARSMYLVGNFVGDERDEVFTYTFGIGSEFLVTFDNGGSPDGELTTEWYEFPVSSYYQPVTGDFDGDGYDEIVWYAAGSGRDHMWDITSTSSFESRVLEPVSGHYVPTVGDFTGDGVDDLLWYAPGPDDDYLWEYDVGGSRTSIPVSINGYYEPIAGSFGSDDVDDVLWYGYGSANDYLWDFVEGGDPTSTAISVNGTYDAYFSLDMRGHGARGGDIFWYGWGARPDYVWDFRDGAMTSRPDPVNGGYVYPAAGDFFGDGHDDVLWPGAGGASYLWNHAPDDQGQVVRWQYTGDLAAPAQGIPATGGDVVG